MHGAQMSGGEGRQGQSEVCGAGGGPERAGWLGVELILFNSQVFSHPSRKRRKKIALVVVDSEGHGGEKPGSAVCKLCLFCG